MGKLTALQVKNEDRPGRYGDGNGLALQVVGKDAKSWVFRYQHKGKERHMGLGSASSVSLADARKKAVASRAMLDAGIDPMAAKRAAREGGGGAAPPSGEAARRYIANKEGGWSNPKHAEQWKSTLDRYAHPLIGDKPCRAITVQDVQAVLRPIWAGKAETATRVRGRIEAIIDFAMVEEPWEGFRNPAVWRGNLSHLFPAREKVAPVENFAALPWREAPGFFARLRTEATGVGALALRWTVLNAARSQMTFGARWPEIDRADAVWTVPAARVFAAPAPGGGASEVRRTSGGLKGAKEFRIPLSPAALRVLDEARDLRRPDEGDLLFPGAVRGKGISNATMAAVLRRLGVPAEVATVHGFRSCFRDWAGENTGHASDIAEAALAHVLPGGKTRAAYQRGTLLEKRRLLMADWADFLTGAAEEKAPPTADAA